MTVEVEHQDRDVKYPILVDPVVYAYWQYGDFAYSNYVTANGPPYGRWLSWTSASMNIAYDGQYTGYGAGLAAMSNPWWPQTNGDIAQWQYQSPPHSEIFRVDHFMAHSRGTMPGYFVDTSMYQGIWHPNGWNWGPWEVHDSFGAAWRTLCVAANCDWNGGDEGNVFLFGERANGDGYRYQGATEAFAAEIYMYDRNDPILDAPTYPTGSYLSEWHKDLARVTLHGTDWGLGMKSLAVTGPLTPGITNTKIDSCGWDRMASPCPSTMDATFDFSLAAAPDGTVNFTARATDILEHTGPISAQNVPIKVDQSGPRASMSPQRLREGAYGVSATATDPYSGVQRIEVQIDGRKEYAKVNASCTSSQCPSSFSLSDTDWKLRPGGIANGTHTITVVAYDLLGNSSTLKTEDNPPGTRNQWDIIVAHSASADIGPGSVNLATGNFTLTQADVAVPAYGGNELTIGRSYNSRDDLDRSVVGPFGPGWTESFPTGAPGAEGNVDGEFSSITEAPGPDGEFNGVVEVTDAYGDVGAFEPKASPAGTYTSPDGWEDLTLTRSGTGTTRQFQIRDSGGARWTFGWPQAGASKTRVYQPTTTQESGTSQTTQYTYRRTAQNDYASVQLTTIRGPLPPGVASCDAPVAGCRQLELSYAPANAPMPGDDAATWGDYRDRLISVDFVAYDPANNAMKRDTVAKYAYDSKGSLRAAWDPRLCPLSTNCLKTTYSYDTPAGGKPRHLTGVASPSLAGWTMEYATYDTDLDPGRLKSVARPGTATSTMVYGVPLAGAPGLRAMTQPAVSAWSQEDLPAQATAIFPDDASATSGSYARATVHYLDTEGREVNVIAPGDRVATNEYDTNDNVIRVLTPENRVRAAGDPALAEQIDTDSVYSTDGLDLLETTEPLRSIKLASGQTVQARRHIVNSYVTPPSDPSIPPARLLATTTTGAQVQGQPDADVRVVVRSYDGQADNLGWKLRQPTSVTVDPNGANSVRRMRYDALTGAVIERSQPSDTGGTGAGTRKTILYTGNSSSGDAACNGKPELAGLPCKSRPVQQPGTPGLPNLPETTIAYNRLWQVTTATDTVDTGSGTSSSRISTKVYDNAGRLTGSAVTSTVGEPVPLVTVGYDLNTGLPGMTTSVQGGQQKTIIPGYDSLGRLASYTDAAGTVSTTSFDALGRPSQTTDGKASQTRNYDPTTGDLISLVDSAVGTFEATYDADGRQLTETMPGGLKQDTTYDAAGSPTSRSYVKTTQCSSDCTWWTQTVNESVDKQILASTGTQGTRTYKYDRLGRLSDVDDQPAAGGCTSRRYGFDANSNRTSLATNSTSGACANPTTGTTTTSTYDAADRQIDTGFAYDEFGRTAYVPAGRAGGQALTSTYFVNDAVRSQEQGGTLNEYELDPALRPWKRTTTTPGGVATQTNHYASDGDSPTWTATGSDWTRYARGIGGDLSAIQSASGSISLQLTDLQGNVIAEASADSAATGLSNLSPADEFGVPSQADSRRYSWLGGKQRARELPLGVIQMGARSYVPQLGRFLQVDPVAGGSASDYDYANQDPINQLDLNGNQAVRGGACLIDFRLSKASIKRKRKTEYLVEQYLSVTCFGTTDVLIHTDGALYKNSDGGRRAGRFKDDDGTNFSEIYTETLVRTSRKRNFRFKGSATMQLPEGYFWLGNTRPRGPGRCRIGGEAARNMTCDFARNISTGG